MFNEGEKFLTKKGIRGTVIRKANIDEFGGDFYILEENYVVEFKTNTQPHATYNFSQFDNKNMTTFKYVMTTDDMIKL